MRTDNDWLRARIGRRRALRTGALGAAGLAGAALIGCGGSEGGSTAPRASSATPTASAAATASATAGATASGVNEDARYGGTFLHFERGDPATLDPFGNLSYNTKGFAVYHYSRLFMRDTKPWPFPGAETGLKGDLAESAESDDGTTWVVKLKPGIAYPNIAPVNGRELTSADVAYSWERLTSAAAAGADFVKFVQKLDVLDDYTLKFTLDDVFPFFMETLADPTILYILPIEADGKFDVLTTAIGSGPFLLDEYRPNEVIRRSANPGWHMKDEQGRKLPRLERYDEAIVPEYQTQLAQFETKNICFMAPAPDDLLDLKDRHPEYWYANTKGTGVSFFYFSDAMTTDQPWGDERVRRAISMAIDRPALLELAYNIEALSAAGFDAAVTEWPNIIPASRKPYYLDPNSPDYGESGQYLRYDIASAKQLLDAAGYRDGFDFDYHYTTGYPTTYVTQAEAQHAMLVALGLRPQTRAEDYNSVYITQTFQGNFDGIAYGLQSAWANIGSYFTRYFTDNPNNHSRVDDPELTTLTAQQAVESDVTERARITQEIQRVNTAHSYYVPSAYGGGASFTAFHPFVKGFRQNMTGAYGHGSEVAPYFWLEP